MTLKSPYSVRGTTNSPRPFVKVEDAGPEWALLKLNTATAQHVLACLRGHKRARGSRVAERRAPVVQNAAMQS